MNKQALKIMAIWMLLLPLASCQLGGSKRIDRRISLRRRDKIPYGTKVAYDGLSTLFPNATISDDDRSLSNLQTGYGKVACVIVVSEMNPSPADIHSILDFVGSGNHVFISAGIFGDSLLHALGLKASFGYFWNPNLMDSLKLSVLQPETGDSLTFSYPGDSFDGWIASFDPKYTTVLGRDRRGRPDFVRFNYKGGGSLYLHFAPLAFSNFFLLHGNNIGYYQAAFSYLPVSVQAVVWDEYFAHRRGGQGFSALGYIMSNPGLAWAFWLVLLLFLLMYLFESKRRQRRIPVVTPLQNTSLDFVQTIGRLYFQRRDNHNLASKMITHFQDLVRTRYNLPVTALDEELVSKLAYRTGYRREELSKLIGYMRELPSKAYVPDSELQNFYRELEAFYKIA